MRYRCRSVSEDRRKLIVTIHLHLCRSYLTKSRRRRYFCRQVMITRVASDVSVDECKLITWSDILHHVTSTEVIISVDVTVSCQSAWPPFLPFDGVPWGRGGWVGRWRSSSVAQWPAVHWGGGSANDSIHDVAVNSLRLRAVTSAVEPRQRP